MDAQLSQLLKEHAAYLLAEECGKIKCLLNGHTMPPRYDVVSAFVKGPKYRKMVQRAEADRSLKKYEPFIVQSVNFPGMLYCALTGQLMDKSVEAVKRHMKGQKFKRGQERFTSDQQDLRPEPSLESFGVVIPKGEEGAQAGGASGAGEAGPSGKRVAGGAAEAPRPSAEGEDQEQEEEPGFWMPEDEGGSEDEDMGESGSGSGEEGGEEAGPSGVDRMEEDEPAQQPAAAAGGSSKPGSRASGGGKAGGSKAGKRAAGKAAGVKAASNQDAKPKQAKRNANKPSAAKKAKQ